MFTILRYFARNHLLAHLTMAAVLFGGWIAWQFIAKEEMPSFEVPWLRISAPLPQATPEVVEQQLTYPLEKALRGISEIKKISSSSALGRTTIWVELDPQVERLEDTITAIKDTLSQTTLPVKSREQLKYFQFKNTTKAIIDLGLYHKDYRRLDFAAREELQKAAWQLENEIRNLSAFSDVSVTNRLVKEIQISFDAEKLKTYRLSATQIAQALRAQNFHEPLGELDNPQGTTLTILSELSQLERLKQVPLISRFDKPTLLLNDIATIEAIHTTSQSIHKIQGHEGIILNLKKSSSYDILEAKAALDQLLEKWQKKHIHAPIALVSLDDESQGLRNRMAILLSNGMIGFILILVVLMIFLDFRSGFWVAMGLPFTLSITLMGLALMGDTINNITLASVIIVLGIVVDDAIIVSESIARQRKLGHDAAAVKGTQLMIKPITASILTTCAAFLPFYFMEGRFGSFVQPIPIVVTLMLLASLYESAFVLPAHLDYKKPQQKRIKAHWFESFEIKYKAALGYILKWRYLVIGLFISAMLGSYWIGSQSLKFVIFPREEAKEIYIKAKAKESLNRYKMAAFVESLEDILLQDIGAYVVGLRTRIGQSRYGNQAHENQASLRLELVPADQRDQSLDQLIAKWQDATEKLPGYQEIKFIRSRFGHGNKSPIQLLVQSNNDQQRVAVAQKLKSAMQELPELSSVEIETPPERDEYIIVPDLEQLARRSVDPQALINTLRLHVYGDVVFDYLDGDEEIEVRLISQSVPQDIDKLKEQFVNNRQGYMIPINQLVEIQKTRRPSLIERIHLKRQTTVMADLSTTPGRTPLELGKYLEDQLITPLLNDYQDVVVKIEGEIADSKESRQGFFWAIIAVLALIYALLLLLYQSIALPFLIMFVIPFGIMGVIIALWAHGMSSYGFFTIIGSIGMIGVVINDAIIMVDRLEATRRQSQSLDFSALAATATTRLRAVVLTTFTTVAGIFPTAYGWAGYDSMLSEMMLAMGWGLTAATLITLVLVPCLYTLYAQTVIWLQTTFKREQF